MKITLDTFALDDLGPRIASALEDALDDAATQVSLEARQRVSGHGALQESISVPHAAGPGTRRVVAAAIYAKFVEFGTRRMPARPFLFPAPQEAGPGLLLKAADVLTQVIFNRARTKP